MAASQQTRTEQHGNQVLHVRGDSDSDLEALFSVLHNKDCKPPISSFKNRKLPASFFRPPEPRLCQHSGCSGHDPAPAYGCGQSHHMSTGRSVSSPAQLPHSLGGSSSQHTKQGSGITDGGGFSDDFTSSLQHWDAGNKCPRYYLNNNPGPWQQEIPGAHMPPSHNLPQQQMKSHHQHHQQQHHHHPQQQPTNLHSPSRSLHSMDFSQGLQDLGPLPHGWEQGITPEGELYYINHIEKTTSWYDPRISQHMQPGGTSVRQGTGMSQKQLLSPLSARRPSPNEQFICLELQKLQKEKERLQHEQEAIACREMMLNEFVRQSTTSPPLKDSSMKCLGPMAQVLQSSCAASSSGGGSGVDPFLGQAGAAVSLESHVRQNSTDSGLGGMGTTYSLPRSPEDYLSNVDEMDIQEGNNVMQIQRNSCFGHMTMNMMGVVDMADAGLSDSDHLMASLGDDIANDLLNEMDIKKMDSMLYI